MNSHNGRQLQAFVTGAAGFIGSTMCDRLLSEGHEVFGWDNLSTGFSEFLAGAQGNARFRFLQGDNLDLAGLTAGMAGCDMVFHFAANADVRFGLDHPSKDLQQNTIATFNVLEAMRSNGIRKIVFSSTGCVYGEAKVIPTPEDAPFPVQTSLYGASKAACEGLIQAYCEGFGFEGWIFRFVSILGERYTHGHVIDFYRQLIAHPELLTVLGDGTQRKSHLHIRDCIEAILQAVSFGQPSSGRRQAMTYNLGTNEYCTVKDSVAWICDEMRLSPRLQFSGGDRGWVGDNPFTFLDTAKILSTGWKPEFSIEKAVRSTVQWLVANDWAVKLAR